MEVRVVAIIVSFIGLFSILTLVDGQDCRCKIEHPQRRFCEADFAFVGTIWDVEIVYWNNLRYMVFFIEYAEELVFKGERFLSRHTFNQTIFTPYYGKLCGRTHLRRGETHLFTGSVENGELTMSFCHWVEFWNDVTPTQKKYLKRGVYARNCGECRITGTNRFEKFDQNLHTDYVNALQMSGYWTRRECHFNPLASATYRSPDCEDNLAICTMDTDTNMCLWKWTETYSNCFDEREILWQLLNGAQPAFTHIRQCREITNGKLKKKCRRAILKQKKLRRRQKQEAAAEERRYQAGVLDLDLD